MASLQDEVVSIFILPSVSRYAIYFKSETEVRESLTQGQKVWTINLVDEAKKMGGMTLSVGRNSQNSATPISLSASLAVLG